MWASSQKEMAPKRMHYDLNWFIVSSLCNQVFVGKGK